MRVVVDIVAVAQKHRGGESDDDAGFCICINITGESNATAIPCFEPFVPDHNHEGGGVRRDDTLALEILLWISMV